MSYLDRLRPASYIAPSGDEFEFEMDTLSRSGSKKGSTQEIIDSKESISQDQGNKANSFQISAYFKGSDYDIPSDEFYSALEQKYTLDNPGILKHPRWGDINVFPFTWTQKEELVKGAMIGRIDITFRKVFPRQYPATDIQSVDEALTNINKMEVISQESAGSFITDIAAAASNIAGKIKSAVGIIRNNMKAITATVEAVEDQFLAIQSGIDDLIDDVAGNIFLITAAVQRLIRLPGKIQSSTLDKINGYQDMITQLCENFSDENETSENNLKNNAIMMQIFAGFATAEIAEASSFTDYTIRSESISAIDSIIESLGVFTDSFDAAKVGGTADNLFSGDHDFFSLLFDTIARINEVVLSQAFDLAAEKRFILKHNSDAITECYKAYGNVRSDTVLFYIESNNLKNDEFIEIPAGRELVVYQ